MKDTLAYEKRSEKTKAIARYDKILTNHSGSAEFQNASKYKARLEALASP